MVSVFENLLGITQREAGYALVIYETYYDESGDDGSFPVFVVAGYGFTSEQARSFEREWNAILQDYGLTHFHMVECAHGKNPPYSDLGDKKCIELQTRLMDLIKRGADGGFACAMPLNLHHRPSMKPFQFCLGIAAFLPSSMMDYFNQPKTDAISVFYEEAHKYTGMASRVFKTFGGRITSMTVMAKKSSGCIQAADVLAWQYAKYIKCVIEGRPVRKDFKSLMELRGRFMFAFHDNRRDMDVMFEAANVSVGTSEEAENIKALFSPTPTLDDVLKVRPRSEIGENGEIIRYGPS